VSKAATIISTIEFIMIAFSLLVQMKLLLILSNLITSS